MAAFPIFKPNIVPQAVPFLQKLLLLKVVPINNYFFKMFKLINIITDEAAFLNVAQK